MDSSVNASCRRRRLVRNGVQRTAFIYSRGGWPRRKDRVSIAISRVSAAIGIPLPQRSAVLGNCGGGNLGSFKSTPKALSFSRSHGNQHISCARSFFAWLAWTFFPFILVVGWQHQLCMQNKRVWEFFSSNHRPRKNVMITNLSIVLHQREVVVNAIVQSCFRYK